MQRARAVSPPAASRRVVRVAGFGLVGVAVVAGAVAGLTRLDDVLPRAPDMAVAIAPTDSGEVAPASAGEDPGSAMSSGFGEPTGASAGPTEPVAPPIAAGEDDGDLTEPNGVVSPEDALDPFPVDGVDPFAWRPDPRSCEGVDHAVVVDRAVQRGWFCEDEQVTTVFPLTSSDLQPDPGVYEVYAKDIKAWSWEFGPPSTMTHFVAFTRGKFKGARIAFHSVPVYSDGSWAQPLESVGTMEHFGDSSGCIRLLPEDAQAVWDFLELGGSVRVIS